MRQVTQLLFMLLLATGALFVTNSHADAEIDLCQATVLSDVQAVEAPASVLKRGSVYKAISQYNINKKTGTATMCSHGGLCYPAQIIEGGKEVETLRLTNCKIGKSDYQDDDEIFYGLVLDRSKVAPGELRRMDIDDKLLQLGLCNACADNATELYLKTPASRCARLVKRVLEGNSQALNALKADPSYCR
jgi:hypothetical protein